VTRARDINASERLARDYLENLQIGDVVHEPDGNVPPDFLVDGRIAVEVRRLNQNEETAGGHRGLEETAVPLNAGIKRLLASLGPPANGVSWYVSYSFERPLVSWAHLGPALVRTLEEFRDAWNVELEPIRVVKGFRVMLQQTGRPYERAFVLGGWSDHDSGGFVVSELDRNLRICIAEKAIKVAKFRHKYIRWWLLLIDHIGYGQDEEEVQALGLPHSWDKVILVSPIDPANAFELFARRGRSPES